MSSASSFKSGAGAAKLVTASIASQVQNHRPIAVAEVGRLIATLFDDSSRRAVGKLIVSRIGEPNQGRSARIIVVGEGRRIGDGGFDGGNASLSKYADQHRRGNGGDGTRRYQPLPPGRQQRSRVDGCLGWFQAADLALDLRPKKLARFRQGNTHFISHQRLSCVAQFSVQRDGLAIPGEPVSYLARLAFRQFAVEMGLQLQLSFVIHFRSSISSSLPTNLPSFIARPSFSSRQAARPASGGRKRAGT